MIDGGLHAFKEADCVSIALACSKFSDALRSFQTIGSSGGLSSLASRIASAISPSSPALIQGEIVCQSDY